MHLVKPAMNQTFTRTPSSKAKTTGWRSWEEEVVNITRFDINDKVMSGIFEGGQVREGRFDLIFN